MLGLEPVIQVPTPAEQAVVDYVGWRMARPWGSRLWVPAGVHLHVPSMADVARNPILPPWAWPDEIVPVPYPAEQRPLNTAWWPTFGFAVVISLEQLRALFPDPFAPPSRFFVTFDPVGEPFHVPPSIPVAGDEESHVAPETIEALVDLARQDRHADFVTLAGAVGVAKAKWDELWRGTRARVGKESPSTS